MCAGVVYNNNSYFIVLSILYYYIKKSIEKYEWIRKTLIQLYINFVQEVIHLIFKNCFFFNHIIKRKFKHLNWFLRNFLQAEKCCKRRQPLFLLIFKVTLVSHSRHWYKADMRIIWYAYHKMATCFAGSEVTLLCLFIQVVF